MDRFGYNPGQPAWISASTEQMVTRERAFIRSVYGWMFGGLLLTSLAALWVAMSAPMQQLVLQNRGVMMVLILAELGLVMFLSFGIQKMSPAVAASAFLIYSLFNGLTLSVVLFIYTGGAVAQAFLTTAGMFAAMSVYGSITKRDLTSFRAFFMMGLIGLLLAMVVNFFLHSTTFELVISVIGVLLFLGLTAYDTQRLRAYAQSAGADAEKFAIIGALRLYLDFVNLFLFMLRIFGNRRR
jgi:FtsH-binding integral membrane protein